MPVQIGFFLKSSHTIVEKPYGLVYQPAIPKAARLYCYDNGDTCYIGTSENVQQRCDGRLAALWEAGVRGNQLVDTTVDIYQIVIDGKAAPPDDLGRSVAKKGGQVPMNTEVDVEQLLIRIFVSEGMERKLRNTTKWRNPFDNPFAAKLQWFLVDPDGIAVIDSGEIDGYGQL